MVHVFQLSGRRVAARAGGFLMVCLSLTLSLTACGPIKLPDPPVPVDTPASEVLSVVRTAASDEASRYVITVRLENPNDFPLPLSHAAYRLKVGTAVYESDFIPNATLPALGSLKVELPAVLRTQDLEGSGAGFEASGTFQLLPPGEIRALMHDMGVPLPTASFSGSGAVGADRIEPAGP